MPDYLTVTCRLPAAEEEHLTQALERWPVLGCQVEDAGSEVDVTVFLDERRRAALPAVCEGLQALGARGLEAGHFAEQDWLSSYRQTLTPQAIGSRFWVDPHPQQPSPPADSRIHLVVEPRQAFGSGSHESTRLVLEMLEELEIAGKLVLDVGTGSGILALAARALGASWVVGFDIDLEAVLIAQQTVADQPRPLEVALFAGATAALRPRRRFDIVLANLLPAQVLPLLGQLRTLLAPGGTLLVSGLMVDQRALLEAELSAAGFSVAGGREIGEWAGLVCEVGDRRPAIGSSVPAHPPVPLPRARGNGHRSKKHLTVQ